MKIVIAPDSYKESLSALEVATAIEVGFREIFPSAEYVKLPVADGGEGTVDAMVAATMGVLSMFPLPGLWENAWKGFSGYPETGKARLSRWRPRVVWSLLLLQSVTR